MRIAGAGLSKRANNILSLPVLSGPRRAVTGSSESAARCQDVILSHKLWDLGQIQKVKKQNGKKQLIVGVRRSRIPPGSTPPPSAWAGGPAVWMLTVKPSHQSHQVNHFCANVRKKHVSDGWLTVSKASSCFPVSLAPAVSPPAASATRLSQTQPNRCKQHPGMDHMTARLLLYCTWRRVCGGLMRRCVGGIRHHGGAKQQLLSV